MLHSDEVHSVMEADQTKILLLEQDTSTFT